MATNYSRTEMLDMLREDVCEIKFIKTNGEERIMRATLNQNSIPTQKLPKENYDGVDNTIQAIRCFDVEKQDWRSFLYDNVLKFSIN